jgi:hypothetical protein
MRDIRDPDTGEVIETATYDDALAECLQEALRRRLLVFTGQYRDGKAIYMRVGREK